MKHKSQISFKFGYESWSQIPIKDAGYAEDRILQKVVAANTRMLSEEKGWERDGVFFNEAIPNFPLFAALSLASTNLSAVITILDFGGGLGTTYFQSRKFLGGLGLRPNWQIVEQPHYVKAAEELHGLNQELRFFDHLDSLKIIAPDLIVLSGVVCYLPEPQQLFRKVVHNFGGTKYIFIDRTPLQTSGNPQFGCQTVKGGIYEANLKLQTIPIDQILDGLNQEFSVAYMWESEFKMKQGVHYGGILLQRD